MTFSLSRVATNCRFRTVQLFHFQVFLVVVVVVVVDVVAPVVVVEVFDVVLLLITPTSFLSDAKKFSRRSRFPETTTLPLNDVVDTDAWVWRRDVVVAVRAGRSKIRRDSIKFEAKIVSDRCRLIASKNASKLKV